MKDGLTKLSSSTPLSTAMRKKKNVEKSDSKFSLTFKLPPFTKMDQPWRGKLKKYLLDPH